MHKRDWKKYNEKLKTYFIVIADYPDFTSLSRGRGVGFHPPNPPAEALDCGQVHCASYLFLDFDLNHMKKWQNKKYPPCLRFCPF